ncbi:hypothetical protein EJ02DRAFT_357676 [Clathrospora elynae]|uniref:NACHT domain-containing protein n=1 Tax=Clathrospora elynae TaxID=706981 RepID=A0A6A5SAL6_9PLEO|nr:hypothetical protein EJ02DRAFT_357676 [Clathrospora elynae]
MDGLSAAASIWSLVQATGALIKYFNAAKSAPKDMSNIQRELSILNSLLITLINLKFHFENSETSREWNSVIRTLGVEHGPFAECADTMAQLNEKVSSKKGFRAIATWAFIKDDVHEMLDKIARLKTTINLILSADQLKLSNLMFTQVKELGSKLNNDQGREMVREALNWISSLNFRTQQARHKSLMDQHTGDWFLHSQEFGSWLEQPSQTLFCPGIPGAGKTMMAATVVNYIENNVLNASASTNLAYIFCDYKSEEEQSVDQLLGCLLQQLIQSNHELAGPLIALHEAHAERKSFPSADEIAGILQAVISKHTDVYIVVDAIDECPQKNRKRRRLLSALQNLQVKTDVLHLLVTSRLSPDVAEAFKDAPTIEVEAHTDDVRRYVRGRFEDFKARLNDDWQAKVEAAVINSTRGM